MSNIPAGCSSLATYYKEAKWYTAERNHKIDTITIHCYVGQVTAQRGVDGFATRPANKKASCNYVVGYDGSIGVSVPEQSYSYCSSDRSNDNRAVTIEVASDSYHPYAVKAKAYSALIDLVTDICRRNNIPKLVWSTDKNDRINHRNGCNMTVHRDYKPSKSCPGQYLYDRHDQIAAEVNRRLSNMTGIGGIIGGAIGGITDGIVSNALTKDKIKLTVNSVGATKVSAKINIDGDFSKYAWSYELTALDTNKQTSKKLTVGAKDTTFSLSNLTPNTAYYLKVEAKGSTDTKIYSPNLLFCTLPDYPKSISNLNFKFNNDLSDNECTISFKPPDSWGEYLADQTSKGYRISLIVNGKIKAFDDNLISYGSSTTNRKVRLALLLDKALPRYGDTLQIGIQTWTKDKKNTYSFDCEDYPVCSAPIYLKPNLKVIDNIYVKINNKFKRSILYHNKQ